MSKHFVFTNNSYYSSNGCDCCEDVYMECYNSYGTDPSLGSAHGIDECYAQALITFKGYENLSDDQLEVIYCMSLDDLKTECKQCGITAEIIE